MGELGAPPGLSSAVLGPVMLLTTTLHLVDAIRRKGGPQVAKLAILLHRLQLPATGHGHSTRISTEMAITYRMHTSHTRGAIDLMSALAERALSGNAHLVMLVRPSAIGKDGDRCWTRMYLSSEATARAHCSCKYLRNVEH